MKILLVDDEPREASLMERVLRRMGHDTLVALHPNDALEMVRRDVDAVITAIDMPGMDGVRLAQQIRLRLPRIPIAFVAGARVATSTVVAASQVGPVLSELWSVSDMRQLVATLSTASHLALDESAAGEDTRGIPEPIDPAIGSRPVVTRPPCCVRVSFQRWSQVEALCDRCSDGPVRMAMRVAGLTTGAAVKVILTLPDRATMTIVGNVLRSDGATAVVRLRLTPERVAWLHTMCHQLAEPVQMVPEQDGCGCNELKVSDIIMGNITLRTQIDNLAAKLKR